MPLSPEEQAELDDLRARFRASEESPPMPMVDVSAIAQKRAEAKVAGQRAVEKELGSIPSGEMFLASMGQAPMDLAMGLGQMGAGATDLLGLTQGVRGRLTGRYGADRQALAQAQQFHPMASGAGQVAGTLATYGVIPSGPANALAARALPQAGNLGRAMAARGLEGAAIGGSQFMEPGQNRALGALAGGALGAGMTGLGGVLAPGLEAAGRGTTKAALKVPDRMKTSKGSNFDIDALLKDPALKKGGGLNKTLERIAALHDDLDAQADQVLANNPSKINLLGSVRRAKNEMQLHFGSAKNLADREQIESALAFWEKQAQKLGKNGWVQGESARNFRKSLADAAHFDKSRTTQSTGSMLAAAAVREQLNKQISNLIPEMRPIDARFAKTIPAGKAVAAAARREENKYPLGLRETIAAAEMARAATTGDPTALIPSLGLLGATRLTSTYRGGRQMHRLGESLGRRSTLRDLLLRSAMPDASQALRPE